MKYPNKIYTGLTKNLRKRFAEHNAGEAISTRRRLPWRLIYYEAFSQLSTARHREWQLKNNGNAMRELKKRVWHDIKKSGKGFTLIETMVAVTILTVAIVSPMTLTTRSLTSAYYARDQIAAFHLVQEAIEAVRSVRDGNILRNALGTPVDLLSGIPSVTGDPFTVDTRNNSMNLCVSTCPPLQTNGSLYGYDTGAGWTATRFTRTVRATFVTGTDEVRVSVTLSWRSGVYQERTFTISENLYRWVEDGSGAQI